MLIAYFLEHYFAWGVLLAAFAACATLTVVKTRPALGAQALDSLAAITALLSLLPVLWLATFWALVLRARIALGSWPYPTRPRAEVFHWDFSPLDPWTMPWHCKLVVILFPIALLTPLAFLPANVLLRRNARRYRGPSALLSSAFLTLLLCLAFDPGSFLEWFAD